MKNGLLNTWIDKVRLNENEFDILQNCERDDTCLKRGCSFEYFDTISDMLKSRLPNFIHNFNHQLTTSQCATNLIKGIFDKLYNDDTIILSTMQEHINVLNIFQNKNVKYYDFEVDSYSAIISKCITDVKSYNNKRIIIYMSGTQIKTGTVISDIFFEYLKNELTKISKYVILILDDVQGMFMIPRNYSIYDLIIGTAHSLVEGYDTGLLWYRSNKLFDKMSEEIGIREPLWIPNYLVLLDIMIRRRSDIVDFNVLMRNYFDDILKMNNFKIYKNQAYHIFSFDTNKLPFTKQMKNMFNDKYRIQIDSIDGSHRPQTSIRIRAQEVIKYSDTIIEGIDKLKMIIEMLKR